MTSRDEADGHPIHDDDHDENAVFLTPTSPAPIPTVISTAQTCDKSWLDLRTDGSEGPDIDLWSALWEWARFRLEHGDDEWAQWRVAHRIQLLTVRIKYEPEFDDAETFRVEGLDGAVLRDAAPRIAPIGGHLQTGLPGGGAARAHPGPARGRTVELLARALTTQ